MLANVGTMGELALIPAVWCRFRTVPVSAGAQASAIV
jgi:hypothetical protein